MAVGAEFGLADLPSSIRKALSSEIGHGMLTLRVRDQVLTVEGRGSNSLTFSHPTEIVVRKSGFTSDRTLMIHTDKASADVPRRMVRLLQNPSEMVEIEISASLEDPL